MHISKHSGYRDFVWAVELNRLCLRLFGLWPISDETIKNSFIYDLRVIIAFLIMTFFCIIPILHALIRVWGDMMLMIDNLQITLPVLIAWIKLIMLRWKRPVFASIVSMMEEDWIKVKAEGERDVMLKWARIARTIVICGYSLTAITFAVALIFPYFGLTFRQPTNLTDGERLLPLQAYYLYDIDRSPQFELTYASQMFAMMFNGTIYTSVDILLGILIFHMCGQLENFKYRLANLVTCKDFNNALCENVGIHLRLIRFARDMEDIFSLMMLGLVLFFSIILCVFGFLLLNILSGDNINEILFSRKCFVILAICILIGHTFLYCVAGEILIKKCEALYDTICELEWYKLEPRNGRNLILLMMLTKEPFHINAGKIIPLTMATFCSLLKTSVGYTSFLLAKQD